MTPAEIEKLIERLRDRGSILRTDHPHQIAEAMELMREAAAALAQQAAPINDDLELPEEPETVEWLRFSSTVSLNILAIQRIVDYIDSILSLARKLKEENNRLRKETK